MGHIAKCAMHFAQGVDTEHEAVAIVTFHFHRADVLDPYDGASLEALAHQLVNWWDIGDTVTDSHEMNGVRLDYSAETRLLAVEAYASPLDPTPAIVRTTGLPIGGASTDGPCPPQTAIGLSWRTELHTRRGRGRAYMPAPRSGMIDSSGAIVHCLSTLVAESAHEGVARWGRVLFRNVADSDGLTPDDRLCVYSRRDAVARTVVEVRAPQVLMTQRHRRVPIVEYVARTFEAV